MKAINAYLNFDGRAREAMEFYHRVLGGSLSIRLFEQMPGTMEGVDPDKVLHARLESGPVVLMASDTPPHMTVTFGTNVWLSIDCESMEEIQRLFAGLGEGGEVKMPLEDRFWGAHFGMISDRFGVNWMFNYDLPKA
jgi:PhnB protein